MFATPPSWWKKWATLKRSLQPTITPLLEETGCTPFARQGREVEVEP